MFFMVRVDPSHVNCVEIMGVFSFAIRITLPESNMTMEKQWKKQLFEDVSSIKNGDFPMSC